MSTVRIGVAGLVTPWNFPVAIPSCKIFPALLAGNAEVVERYRQLKHSD